MNQSQQECAQSVLHPPGNDLYAEALEVMERELFPRVLSDCGWNQSEACDRLGMDRMTLRKKLKAYGICKPEGAVRVNRNSAMRESFPHAQRALERYVMEMAEASR